LKVFGSHEPFFQKGFMWGQGAKPLGAPWAGSKGRALGGCRAEPCASPHHRSALRSASAKRAVISSVLRASDMAHIAAANAASEAIDSLRLEEIVGTIAGDNTIFVAVRDIQDVPELIRRFQGMLKA